MIIIIFINVFEKSFINFSPNIDTHNNMNIVWYEILLQ